MGFNRATDFNGKVFTAQDQQSYTILNILKPYHIKGVVFFLYFH